MDINKIGGRKMLAVGLALLAGGAAVYFRGDVPVNFLALLQTILGAFVGGNIAEHWAKKLPAGQPTVDTKQLEQRMAALQEATAVVTAGIEGLINMNLEARAMAQDIMNSYNKPIANQHKK